MPFKEENSDVVGQVCQIEINPIVYCIYLFKETVQRQHEALRTYSSLAEREAEGGMGERGREGCCKREIKSVKMELEIDWGTVQFPKL